MDYGKKIYRSTSLRFVKFLSVIIILTLFVNLYFKSSVEAEGHVLAHYVNYPHELFVYLLLVVLPCIYFGFIRGVVFFENGIQVNRGLPFLNTFVPFSVMDHFRVINENFFISVRRSDSGDEVLFPVLDVDRAIAILDQHNISGETFSSQKKRTKRGTFKIVIFYIVMGLLSFLLTKLEAISYIVKLL